MKSLPVFLIAALCAMCPVSQAQEDPARSLNQGSGLVSVAFRNETGSPLSLRWLDFEGTAQDYGTIAPQEEVTLETYPGHLWTFSAGQQIVIRYRATGAAHQSLVLGGGAVPAPPATQPFGPPMSTTSPPVTPPPGPQPSGPPVTPPSSLPIPAGPSPNPAPGSIPQTGSRFTPQEATAMVQYHNQVRAEVGVGPVRWSPQIAQFAQQWADELAINGKFEHRPRNQQNYGENLAAGSAPNYSPLEGARQWYEEKKLFRAPNGVFTAALMPAGHYTQMVWRGSTEIGAGRAVIRKGKMAGWTVIVCNYNPPGNMIGAKVY